MFAVLDNDCNSDCPFWQLPNSQTDFKGFPCFSGQLSEEDIGTELAMITCTAYITGSSLFMCSDTTGELLKWTVCKWKAFEVVQQGSNISNAFRLTNAHEAHTFIANSAFELSLWKKQLSKVCILSNIDQDYRILEQIGEGAYSIVFKARLRGTKKIYAVKSISKAGFSNTQGLCSSATREVICLRRLNHPRIVKLERVYDDPDTLSLVLEYIPGGNMLQLFRKAPKFSEEVMQEFMKDLLETIKYMHSQMIVHRDLKPENLILNSTLPLNFKIIDFGLAANLETDQLTMSCGSPGYAAPELLNKKVYTPKVDVYSAGIVAYIAMTRQSPFTGNCTESVLKANRSNKIAYPNSLWRGFSKEAMTFVRHLTETNPLNRPSARRALKDLWLSTNTPPTQITLPDTFRISSKSLIQTSLKGSKSYLKKAVVIDIGEISLANMEHLMSASLNVSSKALYIFTEMTRDNQDLVDNGPGVGFRQVKSGKKREKVGVIYKKG